MPRPALCCAIPFHSKTECFEIVTILVLILYIRYRNRQFCLRRWRVLDKFRSWPSRRPIKRSIYLVIYTLLPSELSPIASRYADRYGDRYMNDTPGVTVGDPVGDIELY